MHSEGINAGEMKHGPLALVDEKLPIVVVATMDSMHNKMQGDIQQLMARSANLIIICNEDDDDMVDMVGDKYPLIKARAAAAPPALSSPPAGLDSQAAAGSWRPVVPQSSCIAR